MKTASAPARTQKAITRLYSISGWSFENGRTVKLGVVRAHDPQEAQALAERQVGRLQTLVIEVHELYPWETHRLV